MPNNALDRSGGSVKSLPISKLPIVDLNRAARSTRTFDLLVDVMKDNDRI
jgi:hypothetical protein